MNAIKKIMGIVWLAMGLAAAYFGMLVLGLPKISAEKLDDNVFGWIILTVLTPIVVGGLVIFGIYALRGEYEEV